MSFLQRIGLQLFELDKLMEEGKATWDQYEIYEKMIAGLNIEGDKFWDRLEEVKKQMIRKDPDAYLQHMLTYNLKTWPHLDTSYNADNILEEISLAFNE